MSKVNQNFSIYYFIILVNLLQIELNFTTVINGKWNIRSTINTALWV